MHAEIGQAATRRSVTLYRGAERTLAVVVEEERIRGRELEGGSAGDTGNDWRTLLTPFHAEEMCPGAGAGESCARIDRALGHLHALAEDQLPSLAWLAATAGLSPFHFLRVFKLHTGLPPYRYYQQLRLSRARRMLRAGLGVAATAFRLGYSDQSHFTREFRAHTATTPARYAAAARSGVLARGEPQVSTPAPAAIM